MDDDAVRGLLEATFRYVNAAGLQEFSAADREAAEAQAVEQARSALTRLLGPRD